MKTMTLYLRFGNDLTFFFTTTSDNAPLFNDGKINHEVLEKKRQEIFSLPSASLGRSYHTKVGDKIALIPQLLKQAGYATNG